MLKTPLAIVLTLSVLPLMVACGDGATDPPERLVTSLECVPGGNEEFNCAMTLSEEAGVSVTLLDTACGAHGNNVRLIEPVDQILTTDGCYAETGTEWRFDGPFPAGTAVAMEIISAKLSNPPGVNLVGEYPTWTIYFEDGDDEDFDDLVLRVSAIQ